jgi:hypothetical protein
MKIIMNKGAEFAHVRAHAGRSVPNPELIIRRAINHRNMIDVRAQKVLLQPWDKSLGTGKDQVACF